MCMLTNLYFSAEQPTVCNMVRVRNFQGSNLLVENLEQKSSKWVERQFLNACLVRLLL